MKLNQIELYEATAEILDWRLIINNLKMKIQNQAYIKLYANLYGIANIYLIQVEENNEIKSS